MPPLIQFRANLAQEYFERRQDRYYLIKSAELADYCCSLIFALGKFSYLLLPAHSGVSNYRLDWPKTNAVPQPLGNVALAEIVEAATRCFAPLIWKHKPHLPSPKQPSRSRMDCGTDTASNADTIIYPLAQLTPLLGSLTTSTHGWAILRLLSLLSISRSWTLATPYLNLPESLVKFLTRHSHAPFGNGKLFNSAPAHGKIIIAAPEAMSFYEAKGLAGYIPTAFGREAQKLLGTLKVETYSSSALCSSTYLLQWQRGIAHRIGGWTFHVKGWWVRGLRMGSPSTAAASNDDMTITVVGSSNYGERSYTLDLEMDVLIATRDPDLKQRIHREERKILAHGQHVKKQNVWQAGIVDSVLVFVLMWIISVTGLSI